MKWSDIIWADIIMSASGPSAQIMSEQITSDKVYIMYDLLPQGFFCSSIKSQASGTARQVNHYSI